MAEALFEPSVLGKESKTGIQDLVCESINKCDIDVRRELFNNIVLSGGTSMLEGMQQRWGWGERAACRGGACGRGVCMGGWVGGWGLPASWVGGMGLPLSWVCRGGGG